MSINSPTISSSCSRRRKIRTRVGSASVLKTFCSSSAADAGAADWPDRLNKGAFLAEDRDQTARYVTVAWHRVWGAGGDMGDEALLRAVAGDLGWDAGEYLTFTISPEAEARYRESTRAAHQRGVFGVPTMMVEDEMWWGNDRLEFLEEFLGG